MISEIEGRKIEPDAENKISYNKISYSTLDLEQMEDINVSEFDASRGQGGAELMTNPSQRRSCSLSHCRLLRLSITHCVALLRARGPSRGYTDKSGI